MNSCMGCLWRYLVLFYCRYAIRKWRTFFLSPSLLFFLLEIFTALLHCTVFPIIVDRALSKDGSASAGCRDPCSRGFCAQYTRRFYPCSVMCGGQKSPKARSMHCQHAFEEGLQSPSVSGAAQLTATCFISVSLLLCYQELSAPSIPNVLLCFEMFCQPCIRLENRGSEFSGMCLTVHPPNLSLGGMLN